MCNVLEKFSLRGAVLVQNFQKRPFVLFLSIVCGKFFERSSLHSVDRSKKQKVYTK